MQDESGDLAKTVENTFPESTRGSGGGLTASCLMYLFADMFVPPMRRWEALRGVPGAAVPSSDLVVPLGPLEVWMVAAALFDLDAKKQLVVSWLEPHERRMRKGQLELKKDRFALRFSPGHIAEATAGLESKLLDLVGDSPCDLFELVIGRWLDVQMPINEVIVFAQREALEKGVLRRREASGRRSRSLRWADGLPDYVGDPSNLARAEGDANNLAIALGGLSGRSYELWIRIRREVGYVLSMCRPAFKRDGGG